MTFLLDTNPCIQYMRRRSPSVIAKIDSVPFSEMAVSAVTLAEMYGGSAFSERPRISRMKQDAFLNSFAHLPFDAEAADAYGYIYAHLRRAGLLIEVPDMQIAATALARGLTVVTHDVSDFSRIPGLRIEDWETD